MTDLRELLGANIKIYRKIQGFSQAKLAVRVDTAANYISAIEAGRRFPSVAMLEKIAIALDIDTTELFSKKITKISSSKRKYEEQIWLSVGKNLSNYISKNIKELKKSK